MLNARSSMGILMLKNFILISYLFVHNYPLKLSNHLEIFVQYLVTDLNVPFLIIFCKNVITSDPKRQKTTEQSHHRIHSSKIAT